MPSRKSIALIIAVLAALVASTYGEVVFRVSGSRLIVNDAVVGSIVPIIQSTTAKLVADEGSINFTPTLTQGDSVTWSASNLPAGASINSSSGQITGTLSTVGHWATELTATNSNGSDTIIVPIIVYGSVITVDSDWLSGEGSAPYLMDTANAVYQLDEDVTEDASVFVVQADGVVLDLAGHTLTYNNDAANTITNQDFDDFTGDDPDDWTVAGDASHTSVAAASSNVFPKRLCEGANALRVTLAPGTHTAGTLTAGTPANIAATNHGLETGDFVIIDGFSATTYSVAHASLIDGGYEVTKVDDNNFTINANVSAVSDGSGTWIKACCIESSSTALPVNNRLYTATCGVTNTPGGGADYDCSIKLVNAADDMELEKITTSEDAWHFYDHTIFGNESRNACPTVTCKSAMVANAKVQIYLASTGSTVIDVFRARLSQSYDSAVLARGTTNTNFPQQYNYSTTGWTSSEIDRVAVVDSVGGGAIVQGANQGFRGWPVLMRKVASGCIVHGFSITVDCDDALVVFFDQKSIGNPSAAGDATIAHLDCTLNNIHNIVRRDSQPYFCEVAQWLGDVQVADLVLTNSGCISVNCDTDNPNTYSTLIRSVSCFPKTVCTNSYAFFLNSNTTLDSCLVNSITSTGSGRGVLINGGQNLTIDGIIVRDSQFFCREERHREASANFFTRALRLRNTENGETTNGTLLDILVENCLFHCECKSSDFGQNVQGARISVRNNSNGMDSSSYVFRNCEFRAINTTGSGSAEGIEIGRWDTEVADLSVLNSEFESNDTCVKLHGNDDFEQEVIGALFAGSRYTKNAASGNPRAFHTFRLGFAAADVTDDVFFTSNSFGAGTAYDDVLEVAGTHDVTIEP